MVWLLICIGRKKQIPLRLSTPLGGAAGIVHRMVAFFKACVHFSQARKKYFFGFHIPTSSVSQVV
jgi:hypothetical protein